MAGTKSKKAGALAKLYLLSYNLGQTLGWSYILYQIIQYYISPSTGSSLWDKIKLPIIIFQNAALLEIIHAATGMVPSNVIITTLQVLSRVIVVVAIILATPYTYAASSPGLPLALIAWSITEIIRYFYYFVNLINIVPYVLVWLRYTTFIILYPLGITGELLCFYSAIKYATANPDSWSYTLPNKWNFTFSYLYFLVTVVLTYIPSFPQLYLHMFAQRRKILNPDAATKKTR
ncbi:very-long-chain (3R)-3-hydroxyacyl-CoA dehydratase 2 [Pogonomyrmex barbatus]|uniref:Very-long-chain (3R)-3-hydroxyacyl-CoA dehydratase n=1 Tax=Pogonomyrmex barbatus TaxID=144034 RepID=A0A6I9W093_9HYME|nr:very-long-chain (3R)-3-hydroxyacyl-CoA dehydratase 2 [Pogonomyrmex barbatus]XP_011634291.1 very-long-chain (3R)-3-hydroxyacyl-CoA dehydratase 2 [Pogonomyrmex barbatus]XP_011634292.1 very-long-chain (3R)-3-hydroxyacyl-CoA dehydratase 2 [Pogonomyrmex barbatus]XP_011634294.1 very-long-chain (3R)-3-hydroxyacyl-CoA dehydratase 2 [Pogonomyrmex barbatus]